VSITQNMSVNSMWKCRFLLW